MAPASTPSPQPTSSTRRTGTSQAAISRSMTSICSCANGIAPRTPSRYTAANTEDFQTSSVRPSMTEYRIPRTQSPSSQDQHRPQVPANRHDKPGHLFGVSSGTEQFRFPVRKPLSSADTPQSLLGGVTGKPILALTPPHGEVARMIRETASGWSVHPKAPAAVDAMLREAVRAFERPDWPGNLPVQRV